MNEQIDWDEMASWAESPDSYARPALEDTLKGDAARQASQELLKRFTGIPSL
ncbi:hypothetical protein [Trueperella pyogenes]|uniref:hypothetical protein n=1 Tax=Trueperella pyogenes TaxID=1661 RepID=UPI00324ECF94